MVAIVGSEEEAFFPGKRDLATEGGDQFVLVLDGLLGRDGIAGRVLLGECGRGEAPGIEDGVADEVCDGAVILAAAGLDGDVEGTGTLILGSGNAGEDLELIAGF